MAKLAPLLASMVGVIIAYLVYRVSADRLYFDLFERRSAAISDLLAAAQERQAETVLSDAACGDLPAQRRFWEAMNRAKPLFDQSVGLTTEALDDALRTNGMVRYDLADRRRGYEPTSDAPDRYSRSLTDVLRSTQAIVDAAKPYLSIGARGLGWRSRWRLSRDRKRRAR